MQPGKRKTGSLAVPSSIPDINKGPVYNVNKIKSNFHVNIDSNNNTASQFELTSSSKCASVESREGISGGPIPGLTPGQGQTSDCTGKIPNNQAPGSSPGVVRLGEDHTGQIPSDHGTGLIPGPTRGGGACHDNISGSRDTGSIPVIKIKNSTNQSDSVAALGGPGDARLYLGLALQGSLIPALLDCGSTRSYASPYTLP